MKRTWRDYFYFSKKERIAIIILFCIMIFFTVSPYFFTKELKLPVTDTILQKQLLALQKIDLVTDTSSPVEMPVKNQRKPNQLFYFDPNTLDMYGWQKLGINDKTIKTIFNYRNKGGTFRVPEDIRKIYSLRKEDADRLVPYVQIKSSGAHIETANYVDDKKDEQIEKGTVAIKKVDINLATAEDLKALPGIGDVLSNRIVKFRNARHGFKSVEDIRKTYGLSDSTFQLIRLYLMISDSAIVKD